MNITVNNLDVCSRNYGDFTVIYDLRNKTIIKLENVAAEIWQFIISKKVSTLSEVIKDVVSVYECNEEDVQEDVESFVEELYYSGVILLDEKYCEISEQNNSLILEDDYEGEIIHELEQNNQVYSATIEMTYACNEKCVHCYADYPDHSNKTPVDIETYKAVIDELLEMKCLHISFTGGDPFMNKDFPELFEYCRNKGFVCDVFTNALFLYDHQDVLERFIKLRPRAFYISLYGSTHETHDRITQTPGSFDKTVEVAKTLVSNGVPVVFNIMILKLNYADAENIVALAKSINAEYRVSMSIIYKNDGDSSPMNYFVGNERAINHVLDVTSKKVYSMDKITGIEHGEYMCGAGVTSLSIAPDGNVYPCVSLKNKLGNIKTETIRSCWDSTQRHELCNSLRWDNTKECLGCKYLKHCPHCAGISQAETGDMFSCNTCDKALAKCLYERQSNGIRG